MTSSSTPAPDWQFRLAVRWRDLDAFNHVNNANYLSYLEEARSHWLHTLLPHWETQPALPVVASVQLHYRAPIGWPAEVWIKLHLAQAGTSSLSLGHRIESGDGAILHCDGAVTLVWIDRTTGRPTPLPPQIRALLA